MNPQNYVDKIGITSKPVVIHEPESERVPPSVAASQLILQELRTLNARTKEISDWLDWWGKASFVGGIALLVAIYFHWI